MVHEGKKPLTHITPVRFDGSTYVATYSADSGTVILVSVQGPGFYWRSGRYDVAESTAGDSDSMAQKLSRSILEAAKERGDI